MQAGTASGPEAAPTETLEPGTIERVETVHAHDRTDRLDVFEPALRIFVERPDQTSPGQRPAGIPQLTPYSAKFLVGPMDIQVVHVG